MTIRVSTKTLSALPLLVALIAAVPATPAPAAEPHGWVLLHVSRGLAAAVSSGLQRAGIPFRDQTERYDQLDHGPLFFGYLDERPPGWLQADLQNDWKRGADICRRRVAGQPQFSLGPKHPDLIACAQKLEQALLERWVLREKPALVLSIASDGAWYGKPGRLVTGWAFQPGQPAARSLLENGVDPSREAETAAALAVRLARGEGTLRDRTVEGDLPAATAPPPRPAASSAAAAPPVVPGRLATDELWPLALAANASHLFWTTHYGGAVGSVSKQGGGTGDFPGGSMRSGLGGIAAHESVVVFTNPSAGTIERLDLATRRVTTLASGQVRPIEVALDGGWAYWINQGERPDPMAIRAPWPGGALIAAPLRGGPAVTLARTSAHPRQLALDARAVYYATELDSYIHVVDKQGGRERRIAGVEGRYPIGLAVDAQAVYFATSEQLMRVAKDGRAQPVELAPLRGIASGMALDAAFVYVAIATAGTVWKVPKGGGPAQPVASGLDDPAGLLVDDSGLYLVTGVKERAVLKLPR
jgi:hypothetical protein